MRAPPLLMDARRAARVAYTSKPNCVPDYGLTRSGCIPSISGRARDAKYDCPGDQ